MYNIKNKVVVITGAGGVLCGSFAKEIAKYGAKLALLDLNYDAANLNATQIIKEGGVAKAYAANVLERDVLEEVHKQIIADLGSCDILINGAGGNNPRANTDNEFFAQADADNNLKTFFDLDKKSFSFVFDLNILGTVIPSQVFIKDMLGKKGCCVLNISSMNAFRPLTKIPAYSAAKSGVSNFTQWLAVHFAKQGIRVNALAPGFFVTKQNADLLFTKEGEPTPRTGKILAATPMERFGNENELLGALMFLIDDTLSGFITGVVLPVDGGFSAYSGV